MVQRVKLPAGAPDGKTSIGHKESNDPADALSRQTGVRRITRRRLLLGAAGLAVVGAGTTAVRSPLEKELGLPLYLRCSFGAYADNAPYPDVYPHFGLESVLRAHLRRMSWFQDMGAPWLDQQAEDAAASDHDLMIAWDPVSADKRIAFSDFLQGRWDDHLTSFFGKAAEYAGAVVIRPFWEMNSSGSPYSLDYTGPNRQVDNIDQFVDTWRHLVQLQRGIGGSRVRWLFCANGTDTGKVPMEAYWPGAQYVDEVGFDTYNDDWGPWASFEDRVRPMYERLRHLAPDLPVSIGEIGCKESGAPAGESKATWLRGMFQSREFPALEHISFFNADKGIDWRLNSSDEALEVHRWFLQRTRGAVVE